MSLNRIREYLDYDLSTGVFTWKKRPTPLVNSPMPGDVAGHVSKAGYVTIRFGGTLYYAHRLAWWWIHGYMPKKLDHKNLAKSDNLITNLRLATPQGNSANRLVRTDARSGYKGVHAHYKGVHAHPNGRYYAYIIVDGIKRSLGAFGILTEAARAYDRAARKNFGEFARLNFGGQGNARAA